MTACLFSSSTSFYDVFFIIILFGMYKNQNFEVFLHKEVSYVFTLFSCLNCFSRFLFLFLSYLFAAVIDLLLGLL